MANTKKLFEGWENEQAVYLYKLFFPNLSMNDYEAKKLILKSRILFKILMVKIMQFFNYSSSQETQVAQTEKQR